MTKDEGGRMKAEHVRRFKPYPAYKDSGVEWLGEIPAHWEVKRLKFAAKLNPVASEIRGLAAHTEVSFVPMEAVGTLGGLDLSRTKPVADVESGYTYFRDGDVLVRRSRPASKTARELMRSGLSTAWRSAAPSSTFSAPFEASMVTFCST